MGGLSRKDAVLAGMAVFCLFVALAGFGLLDWGSIVSTVVGVVAGAAVSWHFARRSSGELRAEADRLRRVANLTTLGLKDAGLVDAKFDKRGDVKSVGVESRHRLTLKPDGRIEVTPEERSPVFEVRLADESESGD